MSNTQTTKSSKANTKHESPVSQKVTDSLHHSVDTLGEKAQAAEAAIRAGASGSAEALSEKQKQIQESWDASSVRKYAVENPVATAGIVFVAGALFGKFLSRN